MNNDHLLTGVKFLWGLIYIPALLFGIASILFGIQTILETPAPASSPATFNELMDYFRILTNIIFIISSFSTALYIVWMRENDHWLIFAVSITICTSSISDLLSPRPIVEAYQFLEAPYTLINLVNRFCFILILYTMPNGRFFANWAKWLAIFWWVVLGIWLLFPNSPFDLYSRFIIPVRPLRLLWLLIGVGIQVYRHRYLSSPIEKQQTKWFSLGTFIATVNLLIIVILSGFIERLDSLSVGAIQLLVIYNLILLLVAVIVFPLFLSFAVLKVTLWEVDFFTNRALVFGGSLHVFGISTVVLFLLLESVTEQMDASTQPILLGIGAFVLSILITRLAFYRILKLVDQYIYNIRLRYLSGIDLPTRANVDVKQKMPEKIDAYTNLKFIAFGHYSEIYRAEKVGAPQQYILIKRSVAAKSGAKPEYSIQQTIPILQKLEHPHIPRLIDYQTNPPAYIALEFIDGHTLQDQLNFYHPLSTEQSLEILKKIADTLDYIHQQGVVHYDVKPNNILLEKSSLKPYLVDFGLANHTPKQDSLKYTQISDTVRYLAPEYIKLNAATIDYRCDLYALGIIAYEMLVKVSPFLHGSIASTLIAHCWHPIPAPHEFKEDLPNQVGMVFERALAKSPAERYPNANEFISALSQAMKTTAEAKV